jgi:hypothetical protein
MSFNSVPNCDAKFFQADWLCDEVVSASAKSSYRIVNVNVASDHDYDDIRAFLFYLL